MAASSESAPLLRQASLSKANGQAVEGPFKDYDTIPSHQAAAEVTLGTPSTWIDDIVRQLWLNVRVACCGRRRWAVNGTVSSRGGRTPCFIEAGLPDRKFNVYFSTAPTSILFPAKGRLLIGCFGECTTDSAQTLRVSQCLLPADCYIPDDWLCRRMDAHRVDVLPQGSYGKDTRNH